MDMCMYVCIYMPYIKLITHTVHVCTCFVHPRIKLSVGSGCFGVTQQVIKTTAHLYLLCDAKIGLSWVLASWGTYLLATFELERFGTAKEKRGEKKNVGVVFPS